MGKQQRISSNSYGPLKQLIIPINNDPSSSEFHIHKSTIVFNDCRKKNSRKTKASSSDQLHKTKQIISCLWLRSEEMQTQMRMFGQHNCMRVIPLYMHQHGPWFATFFTCIIWCIFKDMLDCGCFIVESMKTCKRDWWCKCQWKVV